MGSFFGLQAAAGLGDKICGAAVTFICHEPGLNSLMNRAAPSYKMRFMYMSGHGDEDEFDRFIQKFSLFPIASDIKCPVLIKPAKTTNCRRLNFQMSWSEKFGHRRSWWSMKVSATPSGATTFRLPSARIGSRCWPIGASIASRESRRRTNVCSSTRWAKQARNLTAKMRQTSKMGRFGLDLPNLPRLPRARSQRRSWCRWRSPTAPSLDEQAGLAPE